MFLWGEWLDVALSWWLGVPHLCGTPIGPLPVCSGTSRVFFLISLVLLTRSYSTSTIRPISSRKNLLKSPFFRFFFFSFPFSTFPMLFLLLFHSPFGETSKKLLESLQNSKKSKILIFLPLFRLFSLLFFPVFVHTSLLVFTISLAVFNIFSKKLISYVANVLNNMGRCRLYRFSTSSPSPGRLRSWWGDFFMSLFYFCGIWIPPVMLLITFAVFLRLG